MASQSRKASSERFPLRLMPSIRKTAEAFSDKEGVSLNQFINVVLAEKLAHLEHDEWVQQRQKPNKALTDRAIDLLNREKQEPEEGDELPVGYSTVATGTTNRRKRQA